MMNSSNKKDVVRITPYNGEERETEEITDFAYRMGDIIRVEERDPYTRKVFGKEVHGYELERFWADIPSCEIKNGAILESPGGNGETPDEAIEDLARELSNKHLVFHAMLKSRVEIHTCQIIHTYGKRK